MAIEINGACDDRFLPLKDAFEANFEDGLEVGASLAVMRHGEPVVDLWAGHADWKRTRPWERDTQVLLFSSNKVPLIFSFLMLVDRGEVELDATVATYWPAFAAGGKERVTVREAMTHRAGVPGFNPPAPFDLLHDWDAITAQIAADTHWFGGEARVCYHPVTYGFILGEIIRRVDGRLPSRFFREEIAERAGIDFKMSLRAEDECERLAGTGYLVQPGPPPAGGDPLVGRIMMSQGPGDWTSWARRRADIPSSNGYGNGRAIARLCAIGASGGELDGVRYLSKAMVDEAVPAAGLCRGSLLRLDQPRPWVRPRQQGVSRADPDLRPLGRFRRFIRALRSGDRDQRRLRDEQPDHRPWADAGAAAPPTPLASAWRSHQRPLTCRPNTALSGCIII